MPGPGKPFQKGKSGNPGGRPKVLADVQELARQFTVEVIETLVEIMQDQKAPAAARIAAANSLLDRAFGKPPQTIAQTATGLNATMLSDDELAWIAAGGGRDQ